MKAIRIILTFLIGAGVGAAAGILTAPRSGKKTREKLSDDMIDIKKSLEDAANEKLEEAKALLNKTVNKQAENSKGAIDKMKELIVVK